MRRKIVAALLALTMVTQTMAMPILAEDSILDEGILLDSEIPDDDTNLVDAMDDAFTDDGVEDDVLSADLIEDEAESGGIHDESTNNMEDQETNTCGADLTWTYHDGTLAIDGTGAMYDYSPDNRAPWVQMLTAIRRVELPEGMTSIGDYAFAECSQLAEVVVPDTIQAFGEYAFRNCVKLNAIHIPDGVRTVSYGCFAGCKSLTEVALPASIEVIEREGFYDCTNLTSILIDDNCTTIGEAAFRGCSALREVTLPEATTEFEVQAFYVGADCDIYTHSLKAYYKLHGNSAYVSDEATVIYVGSEETTAGEYAYSVQEDGTAYITGYDGYDESLLVPEEIDGYVVTGIADKAFEDSTYLRSVVLPASLRTLGQYSFAHCVNLESIQIPEGVNEVPYGCFDTCATLKKVELPSTITEIGREAFINCAQLEELNLPEGVTTFGTSALRGCGSLAEIELPSTAAVFWNQAFWIYGKCELRVKTKMAYYKLLNNEAYITGEVTVKYVGDEENVQGAYSYSDNGDGTCTITGYTGFESELIIPEQADGLIVNAIGNAAFKDANYLEKVVLPSTVNSIGDEAFSHCSMLREITIPEGVTEIPYECFNYCTSLSVVNLPTSLTTLHRGCFEDCRSLTSVILPEHVSSIGSEAFRGCSSLETIDLPEATTKFGVQVFWYLAEDSVIHVKTWKTFWALQGNVDYVSVEMTSIGRPEGTPIVENDVPGTGLEVSVEGEDLLTGDQRHTDKDPVQLEVEEKDDSSDAFDTLVKKFYNNNGVGKGSMKVMDIKLLLKDISNGDAYYMTETPQGVTVSMEIGSGYEGNKVRIASIHKNEDGTEVIYDYGFFKVKNGHVRIPNVKGFSAFGIMPVSEYDLSDAQVGSVEDYYVYSDTPIKPEPEVVKEGKTLTLGVDYTITYEANTAAGEGIGHVNGIGEYIGVADFTFKICVAGSAVPENRVEPTCTDEGSYDEVKYCVDCNQELSREPRSISATGHTETTDAAKAATCTESGLTAGSHCSVCGEVIETQRVVPATGHTVATDAAKAATCTESGLTAGSHCSVCGEVIETQRIVPATELHTYGVYIQVRSASVFQTGLLTRTCSVCGREESKVIPKLDSCVTLNVDSIKLICNDLCQEVNQVTTNFY